MKNRMTAAIASILVASLGTAAFAQGAQQAPPQQTPPQQQTPPASNGQTSQNGNASSTRAEHEIKRALTQHGVTAAHVTVAFSNGTATLGGTVYTKQDIAKAKQAAMQVQGVTQVDDSGLHARKG